MNDVLLVVGVGAAGVAVIGPLLNHAIAWWIGWRVVLPPYLGAVPPAGAVGRPPARCTRCGRALAPAGVRAVPAAVVAARCRGCGARLARRYAAVDVATGLLFGAAAAVVGWSAALVPVLALLAGLVAMSAVDLAVMRIPTRFVYLTTAAVAAGLAFATVVDGPARRLGGVAVGAAAFGGLMLVLHLASPRSLGFGDVRLATLVGAVVGWAAWRPDVPVLAPVQAALYTGLVAGLVGALAGGALRIVRGRDRPFPFGPAIAAGGVVVVLVAL
jgi:prepilin signal peptidase PulO-like enzyme (type II secretory pathway)